MTDEKCPRYGGLGAAAATYTKEYNDLLRELAAANAVLDKLPTYADTGKPFVPKRDGAWISPTTGLVQRVWNADFIRNCDGGGDWVFSTIDGAPRTLVVYSTKPAAEAAGSESDDK